MQAAAAAASVFLFLFLLRARFLAVMLCSIAMVPSYCFALLLLPMCVLLYVMLA